MGIELPVIPADLLPLLPRTSQCVALVAQEQAARTGRRDGLVYLGYRRLGAVLGLRWRRQCENAVYDYLAAIEAVLSAA
jgi:hypothetical protein